MRELTHKDMIKLLKRTFSTIIKQKRAEFSHTKAITVAKLGITEKQFYNLETGKSLPNFLTLINIIIVFKIDLNIFVETLIKQGYVKAM